MRISRLTRDGLEIVAERASVAIALRPLIMGRAVALDFPRLNQPTLAALDAWLTDHPRCTTIAVNGLPADRTTLKALSALQIKHGVSLLVRVPRPAGCPAMPDGDA